MLRYKAPIRPGAGAWQLAVPTADVASNPSVRCPPGLTLIQSDGTSFPIRLRFRDARSDPTLMSSNIRRLVGRHVEGADPPAAGPTVSAQLPHFMKLVPPLSSFCCLTSPSRDAAPAAWCVTPPLTRFNSPASRDAGTGSRSVVIRLAAPRVRPPLPRDVGFGCSHRAQFGPIPQIERIACTGWQARRRRTRPCTCLTPNSD